MIGIFRTLDRNVVRDVGGEFAGRDGLGHRIPHSRVEIVESHTANASGALTRVSRARGAQYSPSHSSPT